VFPFIRWFSFYFVCPQSYRYLILLFLLFGRPVQGQEQEQFLPLIQKFYTSWARQDFNSIARLWHPESIYRAPFLDEMRAAWGEKKSRFSNPVIISMEQLSWGVILQTSVEETIQSRSQRLNLKAPLTREFTLRKKGEEWLLWNYPTAEEVLADRILFLPEADKRILLSIEKSAFTPKMVQSLLFRANRQRNDNEFPKALGTYRLAISLATELKDQRGEAQSYSGLGDVQRLGGSFASAEPSYLKALELFHNLPDHEECGTLYFNLAKIKIAQAKTDSALELLGTALKELESAKNAQIQAGVLEFMGNIYYDRGEYSRAAEFYQKNMDLGLQGGNASALVNLGNAYLAMRKSDEALQAYLAALPQVAQLHDSTAQAQVHTGLGHIFFEQKKLPSALSHYQQASEFWKEANNTSEQALSWERQGYVEYEMQNYAAAEQNFIQQYKLLQALDKPMGLAGASSNLGMACLAQQKNELAVAHYQTALEIFQQRNDPTGELGALQNIGRAYYEMADYSKALEYYERGIRLANKSQNKSALSNLLLGTGLVKTLFGQYETALNDFHHSMTLAEELGDKNNLAAMQHNVGLVYANQSHFRMALEYYQKSLDLSLQLQDQPSTARTLGNIGLVLNALGNPETAISKEQQALALWKELHDREGTAKVLGYLGSIYYGSSQFDQALDFFQQGLKEWEVLADKMAYSGTLSFIGDTYFRKKQYSQALESYSKGLQIQKELSNLEAIAALESGIANVYLAMNEPDLALEIAEQAAALGNQTHSLDILWYARFKIGQAHQQLKQLELSEQALTESIQLIEDLRSEVGSEQNRVRFLEGRTAPLLTLFELKVEQGKLWDALNLAEKARLWQMDEMLGVQGRYNIQGLNSTEMLREQQLRSLVYSLRNQLAKTRQYDPQNSTRIQDLTQKHQQAQSSFASLEKKLFDSHPGLDFLRLQADPFNQTRLIQWNAPSSLLVLEFITTEKKLYLACLSRPAGTTRSTGEKTKSSPWDLKIFSMGNLLSPLSEELLTFRQILQTSSNTYALKGQLLYRMLLGSVESQLKGKKQLLILPDGGLWLCPFQALINQEGHFLIEEAAISYAPSLDIAVQMAGMQWQFNKTASPKPPLVQVSGTKPDPLSQKRFSDLEEITQPGTFTSSPQHVSTQSKRAAIPGVKTIEGDEAVKQAIQGPFADSPLMELAVPSLFDDYNPLYSFLLMSGPPDPPEGKESLLETWEIMKFHWNSPGVLLSRSQQPIKRFKSGGALQAWCWALLSNGTPASLVRHWENLPSPPLFLSDEMFTTSRGPSPLPERLDGSKALRRTILKWLQTPSYAHPGFWAAYQWMGCGQ
jgi:tetratricopeptide (TPR) repeat protein